MPKNRPQEHAQEGPKELGASRIGGTGRRPLQYNMLVAPLPPRVLQMPPESARDLQRPPDATHGGGRGPTCLPGRGEGQSHTWDPLRSSRREKITPGGFWQFSASGSPQRAPGPSKNYWQSEKRPWGRSLDLWGTRRRRRRRRGNLEANLEAIASFSSALAAKDLLLFPPRIFVVVGRRSLSSSFVVVGHRRRRRSSVHIPPAVVSLFPYGSPFWHFVGIPMVIRWFSYS